MGNPGDEQQGAAAPGGGGSAFRPYDARVGPASPLAANAGGGHVRGGYGMGGDMEIGAGNRDDDAVNEHRDVEAENEHGGGGGGGGGGDGGGASSGSGFMSFVRSFFGLGALDDSLDIHRRRNKQRNKMTLYTADEEAENEHRSLADVPLSIGPDEMMVVVGQGASFYYRFIKFITLANVVLSLLSFISLFPHLADVADDDSQFAREERRPFPRIFYLSSYVASERGVWTAACVLSIFVMFAMGPTYRAYINWFRGKRARGDADYIEDPFEGQYGADSDECIDRIQYDVFPTRREQLWRRTFSIFVFLTVLVLQGLVNFWLQKALRGTGSAAASTAISFVIIFTNQAWKYLCKYLTHFERHLYYSNFRRWDVMKVFSFRLANVLVLYFVKRYELLRNSDECPLFAMAEQFVILLVIDITVMSAVEIMLPLLQGWVCAKRAEMSEEANEASKPEFDLSEEYTELLYRQFIVGLGMFVVPALPLLAVVGNIAEYWLDKVRMLRIAQKPKRTKNTYKDVLVFFFSLMGFAILLAYPNGAVWVLSGTGGLASNDRCRVFQ